MEEGDDDGEEDGGGVSGDRPPAPNKTAPKKAAASSSSSASSTQQPQQWEWESVRNKLRDALTEMSVLSDVITVATKVNKTLKGGASGHGLPLLRTFWDFTPSLWAVGSCTENL